VLIHYRSSEDNDGWNFIEFIETLINLQEIFKTSFYEDLTVKEFSKLFLKQNEYPFKLLHSTREVCFL
jgi:hypothetical protein